MNYWKWFIELIIWILYINDHLSIFQSCQDLITDQSHWTSLAKGWSLYRNLSTISLLSRMHQTKVSKILIFFLWQILKFFEKILKIWILSWNIWKKSWKFGKICQSGINKLKMVLDKTLSLNLVYPKPTHSQPQWHLNNIFFETQTNTETKTETT